MTGHAMQFLSMTGGVSVANATAAHVAGFASQLKAGGYSHERIAAMLAMLAYRWDELLVRGLVPAGRLNPFREECKEWLTPATTDQTAPLPISGKANS